MTRKQSTTTLWFHG